MAYKVVIDAGHGGADPGAVYNGRKEKDDVLQLAFDVGAILENNGIDVEYTRVNDVYNTPYEKAMMGNNAGADLFVSLHRNAVPNPGTASGVETLVFDDSGLKSQIARNINANLAELGFANRGVIERPNLVVLKRTNMPAVLVEAGFIDSEEDNRRYDANEAAIAQGIADGILETLQQNDISIADVSMQMPQIEEGKKPLYRVQVGGYTTVDGAVALEKTLKEMGYDTFITSL